LPDTDATFNQFPLVVKSVVADNQNSLSGQTFTFAGITEFNFARDVIIPTLSEWGLIAMAGILGIIGFMVMRRRKVTA